MYFISPAGFIQYLSALARLVEYALISFRWFIESTLFDSCILIEKGFLERTSFRYFQIFSVLKFFFQLTDFYKIFMTVFGFLTLDTISSPQQYSEI